MAMRITIPITIPASMSSDFVTCSNHLTPSGIGDFAMSFKIPDLSNTVLIKFIIYTKI